jgi:molecular chaperone DnaK (HSP70)
MPTNKSLLINSIKLVEVDGKTNIPTVICYENDRPSIGYDALSKGDSSDYLIENFKLELGNQDPSVKNRKEFSTGKFSSKSAHALTNDFMDLILKKAENWIETVGCKKAVRILVAEPIAMDEKETVKANWLTNYRAHIRRILESSTKFESVDFLPEPFAVFQYYRYGVRHHLVAQKQKHVALVLDFGGGTFDVSVIETNAAGDISTGVRNSKPLAASSRPVGGFYINSIIAQTLLFEAIPKNIDRSEYQRVIKKFFASGSNVDDDVSALQDSYKHFFRHFRKLLRDVEKAKMLVCNQIQNWAIDAEYRIPVPGFAVDVPVTALRDKTDYASIKVDAYKLRDIFIKKVWNKELKPAICDALARAEKELNGHPISIVLMSGGSANIRWLANLIRSDLQHKLPAAEVLELQGNFQEIVAQGLAIECARRTYNEGEGDFKSVTYNSLILTLSSDGGGTEAKKFKSVTPEVPSEATEGIPLRSSSILGKLIDQPIRWKVKLSRPPKHRLDYYFMRSSFDHEDMENILNVDHTAYTKPNTKFDSTIQVELTVREDTTAWPKFIYHEGINGEPTYEVLGQPFCMDMTSGSKDDQELVGEAYFGFDFGSSNSSISYIEKSEISTYQDRTKDKSWLEFSDLVELLPYPLAAPFAKYIACGNGINKEMLALNVIEAFLGFAAFFSYLEFCAVKGSAQTKLFKGFKQNSAGPLWALLKDSQKSLGNRAEFSMGFKKLLEAPYSDDINRVVAEIAEFKHGKLTSGMDHFAILKKLGNTTNQVMSGKVFGTFENVVKQRFGKKGFVGQFRAAHGKNAPFIQQYGYEGPSVFSQEQIFLVDIENHKALCLSPLMFWAQTSESSRGEFLQLFTYDIAKTDEFSYKATEVSAPLVVGLNSDFSAIYEFLVQLRQLDQDISFEQGVILKAASQEQ